MGIQRAVKCFDFISFHNYKEKITASCSKKIKKKQSYNQKIETPVWFE